MRRTQALGRNLGYLTLAIALLFVGGCATRAIVLPPDRSLSGFMAQEARLWDIASGKMLHQWETDSLNPDCVAPAADGRSLLVLHGDEFDAITLSHRWLENFH